MGEHWVHPLQILKRSIDPRSPSVLSYVEVDGVPVLTGAAFALPIAENEDPPELPFGDVWHVHKGTVDEETLVLNPGVRLRGTGSGYRLAMFHVWTEFHNPDGVFAQDNWVLPFVRLGLPVPNHVTPAAGKAIFLLDGGDAYYAHLLDVAAHPTKPELEALSEILATSAQEARKLVERWDGKPPIKKLEDVWNALWERLKIEATPTVRKEIAELGG
jgi:hypothetical protein